MAAAAAADSASGGASAVPPGPVRFAALDFETADYGRDSACALSIVIVELLWMDTFFYKDRQNAEKMLLEAQDL